MAEGLWSSDAPYEVSISQKVDAKTHLKRIGLIISYVLWSALLIFLGAKTVLLAPFLCFIPLSLWVIVHFTWRLTQIDYEYVYYAGEITINKIYGSSKKKKLISDKISNFTLICPYNEEFALRVSSMCPAKTNYCCSSLDDVTLYLLVYEQEGKKYVYVINTDEKSEKILRYFNPSAFRKKES